MHSPDAYAEVAALGRKTREAAAAAVVEGFADVGRRGVEAVRAATEPLISQLAGVTASAGQADAALRQVIAWATWRVFAWITGLMVVLILLGWLATNGLVWWDKRTINQLQDQISELQVNHDSWVKAGMLDKLDTCGPSSRPCVAVDEDAAHFGNPVGPYDLRVLK